eukprot:XP_011664681.1 PREDICTED: uncharacterized protein LOC100888318 [Strongylocentrotus purpuratus]
MTRGRLSKVERKSMVCISLTVLLAMLLMVCTTQRKMMSSDLEDSSRLRRSLSDNDMLLNNNDTLFSLPCTQELVLGNGTVGAIVTRVNVTNDYVSLVRINITFTDDNLPDDSEQSNPSIWHWGLGGRGRTLLNFPYDNKSLSLNTLSYGLHTVYITINNSESLNDSYSDTCLGYTLSKLVRKVRLQLQISGVVLEDATDDVLCKERYLNAPAFRATSIPGYSLFDLQSSTYYECWSIMNIKTCDQDNCLNYPSFPIYCTIVNIAFGITYILIFLALIYELWVIYSGAFNYQDEDFGDTFTVNILRINLIPPILLMLASNNPRHHKIFYMTYRAVIYAIPFIIYFVAFLWYVTRVEEYTYRSYLRGGMFTQTNAWGLDFALANILYIDGAIVYLYFIHKYRVGNQVQVIEEPYDWKSKKVRLFWYTAVAVLCFFRFSATAMLLVEIVVLTVIGISINIRYGSPIWVNVIIGTFFLFANIMQFFDSYQFLFTKIYSVGTKVDKDDYPNKFFEQTNDGSPQLVFKIKSSLLRDIIRKWLPLHSHLLYTIMYIIVGFAFLAVIAVVVVFIDRTTQVTSFVEYVITAVPFVFAAIGKFGGSALTAGGRAKNRAQDKILILEQDFREYAQTGEFPPHEARCWTSFQRWVSWLLCCSEEPDQQDQTRARHRTSFLPLLMDPSISLRTHGGSAADQGTPIRARASRTRPTCLAETNGRGCRGQNLSCCFFAVVIGSARSTVTLFSFDRNPCSVRARR